MNNDIKNILNKKKQQLTVNSTVKNKSNNTVNSKTVLPNKEETISEYLNRCSHEPEAIAKVLAEKLDNTKYENYYRLLVNNTKPPEILLEVLSLVLDAEARKIIRNKKSIYFIGILKKKGIVTKFSKGE